MLDRVGFDVILATRLTRKFTLEYVFGMLFKWLKISFFQTIALKIRGTKLGRMAVPADFRDNLFLIARKR